MPWQRQVADVALEVDERTGELAYREIIVLMPRQEGKTSLVFAVEVHRCLAWPSAQRVVYTAQTGWHAKKKLLEDQVPILARSSLSAAVRNVKRGAGNEAVVFDGGSRIELPGSSATSGHGWVIDLAVIDEAWVDEGDHREQAILPAMATRSDAQLWIPSTAGTGGSVYLRRKRDLGREAVERDAGSGIAFFEWSVPESADVDDPATWREYMPAFGRTITEETVAHARATMEDAEFRRAFCNQWTGAEETVFPVEVWEACQDRDFQPESPFAFAFDVAPDRSAAAIVCAGAGAVEVVEHAPGVSWVPARAEGIQRRWGGAMVCDGRGPAASTAEEMQLRGVEVRRLSNTEVVDACARMFDAVADGRVKVRPHESFNLAVAGLKKRAVGDRFVWSRQGSSSDITPWMAATLAYAADLPGEIAFVV